MKSQMICLLLGLIVASVSSQAITFGTSRNYANVLEGLDLSHKASFAHYTAAYGGSTNAYWTSFASDGDKTVYSYTINTEYLNI